MCRVFEVAAVGAGANVGCCVVEIVIVARRIGAPRRIRVTCVSRRSCVQVPSSAITQPRAT